MAISVGSYLKDYLEEYGITNKEFAKRIGTTPKNLIDILNDKVELSTNMLINISFVTGLSYAFLMDVVLENKLEKNIKDYSNKTGLTTKDIIKSLNYKDASNKYQIKIDYDGNDNFIITDIMRYLRITSLDDLNKKEDGVFYKKKDNANQFLLAMWLECCTRQCYDQEISEYDSKKLEELISFVQGEAFNRKFNEEKLIKKFNQYGIYLVIQDDVKGTNVRGAFKVFIKNPAIFITRKYKRVADIYFVLLHELAHLKSDYNRGKKAAIVSMEGEHGKDDYEVNADNKALNWMVDDELYKHIKNDLNLLENEKKLAPFLVYRLAWDGIIKYNSKIYQDNNPIIIN